MFKWFVSEFKNLLIKVDSVEVANSEDFVNKVNNVVLKKGEILISFDVLVSLFPSHSSQIYY